MSGRRGRYSPILFDLDGTVADTQPGILAAVTGTLEAIGLPPADPDAVRGLTGRGVEALVAGVLELSGRPSGPSIVRMACAEYLRRYESTAVAGSFLYPGMGDLLGRLPQPLALLTNKPRSFTMQILEGLGVAGCFRVVVAGDDLGAKLKPDPWAVLASLDRLGLGPERAILVGDRESDVFAARAAGVCCCLMRWAPAEGVSSGGGMLHAANAAELESVLCEES